MISEGVRAGAIACRASALASIHQYSWFLLDASPFCLHEPCQIDVLEVEGKYYGEYYYLPAQYRSNASCKRLLWWLWYPTACSEGSGHVSCASVGLGLRLMFRGICWG